MKTSSELPSKLAFSNWHQKSLEWCNSIKGAVAVFLVICFVLIFCLSRAYHLSWCPGPMWLECSVCGPLVRGKVAVSHEGSDAPLFPARVCSTEASWPKGSCYNVWGFSSLVPKACLGSSHFLSPVFPLLIGKHVYALILSLETFPFLQDSRRWSAPCSWKLLSAESLTRC